MIANKYMLLNIIGKGKFGKIYYGARVKTAMPVAIKIENAESSIKLLKNETTILNYLYHNGSRKIPFVHWYGNYQSNPCLIMTYYETSLYDYTLAIKPNAQDSKMILLKIISILKDIHDSQIIHRDVKPQNFMIQNSELYLIDFGLASVYADDFKIHIPEKSDNLSILGTPKYISIHLHEGRTPSRRDDVISSGYIYLFLLLGGRLPWENLPDCARNSMDNLLVDNGIGYDETHILYYKNQERARQKSWTNIGAICQDIGSDSLSAFFSKIQTIGFHDRPNYEELMS
jgi:serine/threonine protein kinase